MSRHLLCLSAADIHGNKLQYKKLKDVVSKQNINCVFLCGDLLPKDGGSWHPDNKVRTIAMQEAFIRDFFLPYLEELGRLTRVYAVSGNDDFRSNYHLLADAAIPNVHFLDRTTVKIDIPDLELYVAGYPYIGVTPFLHKDWEKWDLKPGDIPHKILRTDGYSSEEEIHFPVDLADETSTIKDDLDILSLKSDPTKTVYVFHEAPFDTPLDMIAPDNPYIKDDVLHVGSDAVRKFIEEQKPLLTMHGHIHETVRESGDYIWRSGNSVSLTAGNDFLSDRLTYVLFSIPDLRRIERLNS